MATNIVIGNYKHEQIGQMCLPEIGNVIFGAGKDQWSFTLRTFARHYEK